MRALRYTLVGSPPEVVEVATPEPPPGGARVRITAAGACHSDTFLMSLPEEQLAAMGCRVPMTLGHEGVGVVDAVGAAVFGVEVGTPVAVYGPWGCGHCYPCSQGKENYCTEAAALGIRPPGLGADGTMADHLLVPDVRHLVPLDGLDPVGAVALTDAGLTPYHAIRGSLPKLVPGSTAVVIGAGGLGHVAIQILRGLTAATVIALDVSNEKLALATEVGAQYVYLSDADAAGHIRDHVGPRGATAVFDFVTTQPTIDLGQAVLGAEGDLVLVGVGAGQTQVGMLAMPYDATIRAPYWGSRPELVEVLELARAGVIHVATETFSLDQAPEAYRRLHDGTLLGRAVVVP